MDFPSYTFASTHSVTRLIQLIDIIARLCDPNVSEYLANTESAFLLCRSLVTNMAEFC